jgi:hypothetical protein
MAMREREGLIARVRQMRRAAAAADTRPGFDPTSPDPAAIDALERRVAHLEELLEGLQDSVHRESARESKRIAVLEARLEPEALAVALSQDARERGL